eukprot:2226251-Rhodomonas_salina.4
MGTVLLDCGTVRVTTNVTINNAGSAGIEMSHSVTVAGAVSLTHPSHPVVTLVQWRLDCDVAYTRYTYKLLDAQVIVSTSFSLVFIVHVSVVAGVGVRPVCVRPPGVRPWVRPLVPRWADGTIVENPSGDRPAVRETTSDRRKRIRVRRTGHAAIGAIRATVATTIAPDWAWHTHTENGIRSWAFNRVRVCALAIVSGSTRGALHTDRLWPLQYEFTGHKAHDSDTLNCAVVSTCVSLACVVLTVCSDIRYDPGLHVQFWTLSLPGGATVPNGHAMLSDALKGQYLSWVHCVHLTQSA